MLNKDVKGSYILNDKGAKIYMDIKNHEFLEIPDVQSNTSGDGVRYNVLSVGFLKGGFPLVTIKINDDIKAYRLPVDLSGWVKMNMLSSHNGVKMFPGMVEFGRLVDENRVYAEIL